MPRNTRDGERPRRYIKFGVPFVLAAIAAGWWFRSIQQPVSGTVLQTAVQGQSTDDQLASRKSRMNGNFVSFEYPAIYGNIQNNPPAGRTVEQYSLIAKLEKAESRRLSLTVNRVIGQDTMREDSAYKFRSLDPNVYNRETVTISRRQVDKFSKHDGAEETYFADFGEYYVIVAATSSRPNGDYTVDAAELMSSLIWNK